MWVTIPTKYIIIFYQSDSLTLYCVNLYYIMLNWHCNNSIMSNVIIVLVYNNDIVWAVATHDRLNLTL